MRYTIFIIIYMLIFSSCSDFLEEKTKDMVIPKSVKHYEELLYGEAYFRANKSIANYLEIMSDDVKLYVRTRGWSDGARTNGFGYYTWQKDPEITTRGTRRTDKTWEDLYHSILMCNMVIQDAPEMEGGLSDKESLLGEAHFLRAFSYFYLVNLYGQPYEKESAETDLGVPINDVTGMKDVRLTRSTNAVVYKQIMDDLNKSIEFFSKSGKTMDIFKGNINAAYLLASRTSLYMKNYKDVVDFATAGIGKKPGLFDLNIKSPEDMFINSRNSEILYTFGSNFTTLHYEVRYSTRSTFLISDELFDLYASNDLRTEHFFTNNLPRKTFHTETTGVYGFALRSAEFYLNRAEAYAEQGEIEKAKEDLYKIRKNRYSNADYTIDASTKEEMILVVRNERRKELCFERHRWFDLRRWGMPRIEHVYYDGYSTLEEQVYVLEQGDEAYTLPIPHNELSVNKVIKNIERKDRKPVNN